MNTDAISLYAKPSAGFAEKLAATEHLLKNAVSGHPSIVQASSLGAEDMVLTHIAHGLGLNLPAFVLDTGVLHPQTLALMVRTELHYGIVPQVFRPAGDAVVAFVQSHGRDAMYQSVDLRKACCALRKLEPLGRALEGKSAWVTGLRSEQSDARSGVAFVETEPGKPVKFNPLADWTWGDAWHFIATERVPYNALHDEHFPSIGCAPCTRAITLGEDLRAGRWWWENQGSQECGLHVKAPLRAQTALVP